MATPKAKKQASISRFFSPKSTAADSRPSPSSQAPKRAVSDDRPTPYKSRKTALSPKNENAANPGESAAKGTTSAEEIVDVDEKIPEKAAKLTKTAKTAKTRTSAKAAGPKLTPLEQQYSELKQANPDKVLAIQVGYKYKFFGQDAVVAAQLLNIMLIPGNILLDERRHERFAYCSIPDVRLHIHLQRLLNQGLKVAVVKQTEVAAIKSMESSKSSLFQRQITAVYTKATYMGDENVDGRADTDDNGDDYIVAIYQNKPKIETCLVAVQPATGEIVWDVFACSRDELDTRLAYMVPSEVLLIEEKGEEPEEKGPKTEDLGGALRLQIPGVRVHTVAKRADHDVSTALGEFFSAAHLTEFFHLTFPAGVLACIYELARYLHDFRLSNVFTVPSNFSAFSDSRTFMVLPAGTLRALDVFQVQEDPGSRKGTLLWLLDNTITRSGAHMLRKWISRPLVRRADIEKRVGAVATLVSGGFVHLLDAFRASLVKLAKSGVEIDRSLTKVHYSATQESDRVSRKEIYLMLKSISDTLAVFRDFGPGAVEEFRTKFPTDGLLAELLEQMLGFSAEETIDGLLAQIDPAMALSQLDAADMKQRFFNLQSDAKFAGVLGEKAAIAAVEEELHAELLAIRKLLGRPQLQYVTVLKDTHLVEVRNGKQADSLPADWLKISATKTVSRYRPSGVAQLHKELQYHTEKLMQECDKCFKAYLQEVDTHHEYIRGIVTCMARFDCLLSLAAAAKSPVSHVQPEFVDSQTIAITSGFHPILSHIAPAAYVPNDLDISYDENRVLIITGPNMGGKSSLVKQVALSVIMAQVGCFLPCTHARLGVFDAIHIRMGASDNILRGQSTFMVEMQECASIVSSYTEKSLVILDEIGRGTGTQDGVALAYAILSYIIQDRSSPVTLFITHYPSLHVLEQEHRAVHNYHMAFIEQKQSESDWPEVIFLYKMVRGVVSNSYGLNVAKLAGVPGDVIDAAYHASEKMKREFERQVLLRGLQEFDRNDVYGSLDRMLQLTE